MADIKIALLDDKYKEIISKLDAEAARFGLEISPFKIGWYNQALKEKKFAFSDMDSNTLAFVVISSPSMFEKAFLPYLEQEVTTDYNKRQ